jgi:hypothetical protein
LLSRGAERVAVRGLEVECRLRDVRADTPTLVAALVEAGAQVLEVTGAGDLEKVYLDIVGAGNGEPDTSALAEAA